MGEMGRRFGRQMAVRNEASLSSLLPGEHLVCLVPEAVCPFVLRRRLPCSSAPLLLLQALGVIKDH